MALALPVRQGTDDWLAARRLGIGSSDAAIIAGERGSVLELWGDKTGLAPKPEPDEALAELYAWGHRLEPIVAEAYTERTGRPVRRAMRLLQHPNEPWAIASLDRVSAVKGERRIVELKVTSIDAKYADGEVPGDVLAQVQHQMWVTGYDVADVAVLQTHWRLGVFEVERDDAYLEDLVYMERHFWDMVERREFDHRWVDGSDGTRRALARLFATTNGAVLPADGDLVELADRLRAARIAKKTADADEATVANAIRAVLGEAEGVAGLLTLRKNADSVRVNWPGVAGAYRSLLEEMDQPKEQLDALAAIHSETVQGARVLRLLKESS